MIAERMPTRDEIIARRARLGCPRQTSVFVPMNLVRVVNEGPSEPIERPDDDAVQIPRFISLAKFAPVQTRVSRFVELCKLVGAVTGVERWQLEGPHRKKETVKGKKLLYWLAYRHTRLSYPQIGGLLNKDHTTILHGSNCVQRYIDAYEIDVSSEDASTNALNIWDYFGNAKFDLPRAS